MELTHQLGLLRQRIIAAHPDLHARDLPTQTTAYEGYDYMRLGLFVRMYLEPATKVGPAMPEILYDRVMKFSPRPLARP